MARPRFSNSSAHEEHGLRHILRWKLGLPPREKPVLPHAPDQPAPRQILRREDIAEPTASGWRVAWLGHASFLLQGAGLSLLIDPVFSAHCAPLRLPFLPRQSAPPCTLADLPAIDAVLLTHSHYDHLDLPTLKRLGQGTPLIVPEGHASWLRRAGFKDVAELSWFSSQALAPGVTLTATPAQHFTARTLWDRNQAHWCGWHLAGGGHTLWHAGDSAYSADFREIGRRLGPIDFGMIPIGAYQPRHIMRTMHMNPEEAVTVFRETGCRRAVAMHWGTFKLTDEPLGEPPLRLAQAMQDQCLPADAFVAGAIGQVWTVG